MALDSVKIPKLSLAETLFGLFLRLVAVSCFWFGLNYWAMLIGFSFGGGGRFDLLPVPWRVAATALAVIYPVAARRIVAAGLLGAGDLGGSSRGGGRHVCGLSGDIWSQADARHFARRGGRYLRIFPGCNLLSAGAPGACCKN